MAGGSSKVRLGSSNALKKDKAAYWPGKLRQAEATEATWSTNLYESVLYLTNPMGFSFSALRWKT